MAVPNKVIFIIIIIIVIIIIIIIITGIRINNDFVMHRQVKTSHIISRRFGDFMTPLTRLQMRIKLTNARSRVTTQSDLHSGGGYTDTSARIESACTFKLLSLIHI